MSRSQSRRLDPRGFEGRLPGVSQVQRQRRPEAGADKTHLRTAVAIGAISLATVSIGVASIRYASDASEPQYTRDPTVTQLSGSNASSDAAGAAARPSIAIHGSEDQTGRTSAREPLAEGSEHVGAGNVRHSERRTSNFRSSSQPGSARDLAAPSLVVPVHGPAKGKPGGRADIRLETTDARVALRAGGSASRSVPGRGPLQDGVGGSSPTEAQSAPAASPSRGTTENLAIVTRPGPNGASQRPSAALTERPPPADAAHPGPDKLLARAPAGEPSDLASSPGIAVPSRTDAPDDLDDRGVRPDAASLADHASSMPQRAPELPSEEGAVGVALRGSVFGESSVGSGAGIDPSDFASQPPVVRPAGEPLAEIVADDREEFALALPPPTLAERASSSAAAGRLGPSRADAGAGAGVAAVSVSPPSAGAAPGQAPLPQVSTRASSGLGPAPADPPRTSAAFPQTLSENDWVLFSTRGPRDQNELAAPGRLRAATVSIGLGAEVTRPGYGQRVSQSGGLASGAIDRLPLRQGPDGTVYVRLEDLIKLLESEMERPLFVWLKSSASASKYVTFDTLRAAGIDVEYDASINHLILSAAGSRRP